MPYLGEANSCACFLAEVTAQITPTRFDSQTLWWSRITMSTTTPDEPSAQFPHQRDDCSGNLTLETTGEWIGDRYLHRWYCPECETTAVEEFTASGFITVHDDTRPDN